MRIISIIVSIFIVILAVTFAVLNSTSVDVNLIFITKSIPLSLTVVVTFGLGALFGILAGSLIILKLKRANSRLDKQLKKATPVLDMKSTMNSAANAERDSR